MMRVLITNACDHTSHKPVGRPFSLARYGYQMLSGHGVVRALVDQMIAVALECQHARITPVCAGG